MKKTIKKPKSPRNSFEGWAWGILKKQKELQVSYESDKLFYSIPGYYCPDFTVVRRDGSIFYIETKGHFDYAAQRKMLAVKQSNPEADIRFVFFRDNCMRKGAKMRYSDWATKHGFPWTIKEIPKEWFNA